MAGADSSSATSLSPAFQSTPNRRAGDVLHANLLRLAARRNALVLWHALARALSWGFIGAAIPVLAYRFYLVDGPMWIPAIPILISLGIGLRLGVLQRRDAFGTALEADEKLDLKETLSSAYAFSAPNFSLPHFIAPTHLKTEDKSWRWRLPQIPFGWHFFKAPVLWAGSTPTAKTELVPSLVEEAASQSQSLQPQKIYPLAFDRTHRVLILCAAIFALTVGMPNVPWLLADEEQAARKTIALQGKELVEVAKEVKKEETKKPDSSAARQAKKLEALGQKMLRGRMGKKEALTSLGELKKDLEKAAKTDSQNSNSAANQQMQAALEQMAEQPMDSEAGKQIQDKLKQGDAEAAAKEMEKLADKIEKGQMSAEEKHKAAADMNKIAQALKKQGGAKNEEMAQQLEQAAKALQEQAKGQSGNQQQQKGEEGKSGQQGAQGGKAQQQQNGGNEGASSALRQMAKSMRQGGAANSKNLQKMLDKIREAEAESGSAGDKQFDGKMTKPGAGNCQGGNCEGEQMTPGKDLKSSDPHGAVQGGAGLGPRNNATGSKSGGGVSDKKSKRTGDKRRWEDVWSDRVPATRKKIDRVQGKYGEEGETEQLPTKTEAKGGPAKTPYYEVYESYHKDAEDAVNKERVPPAYKQPVKDYFESIKPN